MRRAWGANLGTKERWPLEPTLAKSSGGIVFAFRSLDKKYYGLGREVRLYMRREGVSMSDFDTLMVPWWQFSISKNFPAATKSPRPPSLHSSSSSSPKNSSNSATFSPNAFYRRRRHRVCRPRLFAHKRSDSALSRLRGRLRDGSVLQRCCRPGPAVNYHEGDRIVKGQSDLPFLASDIQVGDTINTATRVLSFCEPGEIMFTETVHQLLRRHDLEKAFPLHRNERLVTKHEVVLETYTYKPAKSPTSTLYSPHSPLHAYKRFAAFPPIKAHTLWYFMETGLMPSCAMLFHRRITQSASSTTRRHSSLQAKFSRF